MNYQDLNDFELVNYVRENIEEANDILLEKYIPLVKTECAEMIKYVNNCGIDESDLLQEGMIGLTNAINSYEESSDNLFYTYAKTCIRRNLISFIITAKRQKHKILNESLSYDNAEKPFDNLLKDDNDPLTIIVESTSNKEFVDEIKAKLTNSENEVFELMLANFKYKEIAEILNKDVKSVDNAIQRIRLKAKTVLNK